MKSAHLMGAHPDEEYESESATAFSCQMLLSLMNIPGNENRDYVN
jgi:hypothetical protein